MGFAARRTFVAVALGSLLCAARPADALVKLQPSPHLVAIADPACDVVITPANAAATFLQLDDPTKRVFCVDPGDYRSFGGNTLAASGTAAAPRFLRFNGPGATKAFQRTSQAILERLDVQGDHWIVQGLTFRPISPATVYFVSLRGASHVVLDGNLIDGAAHPNGYFQVGVYVAGLGGAPATDDTIQRNVIRDGDASRNAGDYLGVMIAAGYAPGEANDRNRVLDNEIVDWGDGVAVAGWSGVCAEPARQHGTVVDGNDVYVTAAKYVDCTTGVSDPEGDCACAENGIDVKPDPGSAPADWTLVTRNRVWGMRPTTNAVVCGGSGALGQAITAGNLCPGHVFVAKNFIGDSTVGVEVAGDDWIVAGNLLHDIQPSDGHVYGTLAIQLGTDSQDVSVQWNTVVDALNAYDDRSAYTDTRCNAVLGSPEWIGWGWPRGVAHFTEYNYLYEAGYSNLTGPTNEIFANRLESQNQPLCYERRRWTGPETACVGDGATTGLSPHAAAAPFCNAAIGADFGMPAIGFPRNVPAQPTCGLGAELAIALAALRRRAAQPARSPT